MALTLLIRCENVGQKSLIRLVKFKPISKKLKTGKTNILTHYSFARLLLFNPLSNLSLTTDPVNSFLLLLKKMLMSTLFWYMPPAMRSLPHVNRGAEPEFSSNAVSIRHLRLCDMCGKFRQSQTIALTLRLLSFSIFRQSRICSRKNFASIAVFLKLNLL